MKKVYVLSILSSLLLVGCKTNSISDPSQYEALLSKCKEMSDFHTELFIFPEHIEIDKVLAFEFKEREDLFTGSYLFYLKYQYEDDFTNEIERLKSVKAIYNNGYEKKILNFEKENIVVSITRDSRYEFAKFDVESKVISYVSNQLFTWKEIGLEDPGNFTVPADVDDGQNSYNMYYRYEGNVGYYIED